MHSEILSVLCNEEVLTCQLHSLRESLYKYQCSSLSNLKHIVRVQKIHITVLLMKIVVWLHFVSYKEWRCQVFQSKTNLKKVKTEKTDDRMIRTVKLNM